MNTAFIEANKNTIGHDVIELNFFFVSVVNLG